MISPAKIKVVAERYYDENIDFRSFLKEHADYDEIDAQFLELHNKLFKGYDCSKCSNCCKAYAVIFNESDIKTVSKYLGLTKDNFIAEYLEEADFEENEYKVSVQPCTFLAEDGKCKINDCKPYSCKGFPFTDQPERMLSMLSIISFAEECPVVFEILERLKKIYDFK